MICAAQVITTNIVIKRLVDFCCGIWCFSYLNGRVPHDGEQAHFVTPDEGETNVDLYVFPVCLSTTLTYTKSGIGFSFSSRKKKSSVGLSSAHPRIFWVSAASTANSRPEVFTCLHGSGGSDGSLRAGPSISAGNSSQFWKEKVIL